MYTRCVTVCLTTLLIGTMAMAEPAPKPEVIATRDRLLAELEKKAMPEQLLLRFDEGADRDAMLLTLRRTGGQWATGYAEVPGWQQSTMQEWRGFYLGNEVAGCWRPNMRFPADLSALKLDGDQLSGTMAVAYRLDQTRLQREPPGKQIQWWDKFIPGGYTVPRQQNYTVTASLRPGACLLEMVLVDGLYWDPKFAGDDKRAGQITRRPISIRLQVPSTRFTLATARTPTWNQGYHEVDPTGLKFADGKLTGTLVVFIHQDGWMPWGGGKHIQHEGLPIKFEVNAELKNNELTGKYTASLGGELKGLHYSHSGQIPVLAVIPDTKFEGAIGGRGGKLVIGRYTAQGDLGEQIGAVDGMLLDAAKPVREQMAASKDVFHQVRALHLALQHYPLPFDEAYRQTDMPSPKGESPAPVLGDLDAKLPVAIPETVGDSPSLGATALANNELPADAPGWYFLPQWSVLGPFEPRVGLENNTGVVPDLVVVPDAEYTQPLDRLGAVKADEKLVKWQPVTCTSPRLGVPWEGSGIFVRYSGGLWYGAATLRSAQARTVWLSLEANDFAKLWVNNRLVWTDTEKVWRYRPNGRVFVPVTLQAGDNQLLARVLNDRRVAWLRLALTTKEPATPPLPAKSPSYENPHVFPDAQPPLVWDIPKGINVAWRNAGLGGKTRPVVAGDALLVAGNTGMLQCLDLATGKERWSAKVGEGEVSEPVTNGKMVWCHAGAVSAYDLAGKQIWTQPTTMAGARLYLHGDRLIVEGAGKGETTSVVVLEAATGKELKKWELPGKFGSKGQLLAVGDAAVLLTSRGALLDIVNGTELPPLDIEMQVTGKEGVLTNVTRGPYALSRSADMLFLTSQARHQAVRLWAKDGKLGYAHAWESNYGNSGFGNVAAPAVATDKYLFTTHSVLAHTPHSPDPRAEINVQDVKTGQVLQRLKPAMEDLYSYGPLNLKTPTVAGAYVYLWGGRSDGKRSQIAIASADNQLQLIASNEVDPGDGVAPVFAGGRMFLRSAVALTCVAVTTPEGRRYQDTVVAQTLLRGVGQQPMSAKPRVIDGLDKVSATGDAPVGKLIPGRTTEFWLGAGPLAAADLASLKLPDTAGVKFAPLDRDHAYNEPPAYNRTGELQGTGDLTPTFQSALDPRGNAGPAGSGLFYTVLDNTRDRVVVPGLRGKGITQWLGGQELRDHEPLYLRAGLYPYLVKVDPAHFQVETKTELPTIQVTKALAAGAIRDIGWPKSWQVLGPVPPDAPPLTDGQMQEIPQRLTTGDISYTLYPVAVEGNDVSLAALAETAPGRTPDFVNAPKTFSSAVPYAAYLFAAIDCPADGYLYITGGSDWFMKWFVDGEPLSTELKEGVTGKVDTYSFTAAVKKGRHVVVAMVKPGSRGWQLSSTGGFSEKSPDQLPEFRIAAPAVTRAVDLRLNPSFQEVPHPQTLEQLWRDRATRNRARLEAIVRDLPGSEEAKQASEMLEALK
jgi:hypothetical protein